jgi:uncharacterized protein YeaO (DUF488 family)
MQQQPPRVRRGRVYDEHSAEDGTRALFDHRWPRGLTEDRADVDEWCSTSEAAVLADLLVGGRAG